MRRSVILGICVLLLGAAMAYGSSFNIPVVVTTAASVDNLQIGFSETVTTNVGQLPSGAWVNEIDIRETSIGGTYLSGTGTIPANCTLLDYAGTFYMQGGYAYLSAGRSNGTNPVSPLNSSLGLFGDTDCPGYWSGGSMTTTAFNSALPSPSFSAVGAGMGTGSYTFQATQFTVCGYTSQAAYDLYAPPNNPGGAGYDNQLLAAFYVSPSVTGVQFYTDDGQPWNVNNSTGGYGQMGFGYGGGRTDYVEINPIPSLPGDANRDGTVNINDLSVVLTNYDKTGMWWAQGDFSGDGKVDINDLSVVLTNYDKTTTSSAGITAVPEPSSMLLLAAAALVGLLGHARRKRS